MATMLFCNIARMASYQGYSDGDVPSGGGSHPEKEEVNNFNPLGEYMFGYVAAVNHAIDIRKLGAVNEDWDSIDGIDVIWTAPSPNGGRDVVGWYRNATVFRHLQSNARGKYHVKAAKTNCRLLPVEKRNLNIESGRVRTGGFGRNTWYADSEYGAKIRKRVMRLMRTAARQIFDRDELEAKAAARGVPSRPPRGERGPWRDKREVTVIGRDPAVHRWTLHNADGRCELCGEPAPFTKPNGQPYLEVHHILRLAERGTDTPDNTVALCPNCHREAHLGTRAETIGQHLRELASAREYG